MDVILVNHKGASRTLRLRRGPGLYFLFGVPLAILTLGLLAGGFYIHSAVSSPDVKMVASSPNVSALLQSLQAKVTAQQAQVQQARQSADANVSALGRKLAQLQADMMRLDAAGQRMVKIAHIDSSEFDFSRPAPQGGPDTSISKAPDLGGTGMVALDKMQAKLADRKQELAVLADILRTTKLRKETEPRGWPIKKGYISSRFGYRVDPFTGHKSFHPGIDLAGPKGETVHAVAAGIVVHAGPDGGYGNMVEINHGNGVETIYGHNEKILVHVGQKVLRGQTIAKEGSTGRSTGPHCHFEVRINGKVVNPLRFLRAGR